MVVVPYRENSYSAPWLSQMMFNGLFQSDSHITIFDPNAYFGGESDDLHSFFYKNQEISAEARCS